MVKVKISPEFLKQLVDILNVYEVDAPIIFNKDKAVIKVIDITRTAMIVAEIESSAFIEYSVDEDEEVICIPKDKLNSIMKSFKENVTIETSGGEIIFQCGKSTFKLHNIVYDENLLKLALKLDYDISFDVSADQFKYIFEITSIFNQYTVISFKCEGEDRLISFRSSSETDGSADISYTGEELKNVVGDHNAVSAFSSMYFKGLMKLKPNRFIVSVADDKPIRVVAPLMEGKCKCTIMVAPVILGDD